MRNAKMQQRELDARESGSKSKDLWDICLLMYSYLCHWYADICICAFVQIYMIIIRLLTLQPNLLPHLGSNTEVLVALFPASVKGIYQRL